MINLTKGQKFIIVLTGLWECFLLVDSSAGRSRVRWDDFFILSLPFILYWSGVWIFGFGYILKYVKKVVPFVKWLVSLFYVLSKSLLKTGGYALIVVLIFGIIVQIIKAFSDSDENGVVNKSATTVDEQEAKEVAYDYGRYYGQFIWIKKYCLSHGVDLKHVEQMKKIYNDQINNLVKRANSITIGNGEYKIADIADIETYKSRIDKEQKKGFDLMRTVFIAEKLSKTDLEKAMKIYKNISDKDILKKYGYMISEREVCLMMDKFVPEDYKIKDSITRKSFEFLDKYSFNFVPDKN